MIQKSISDIQKMIHTENDLDAYQHVSIKGVSINTKTIEAGNLFVPLKGDSRDGHEFVIQAFENGAAASLWQKDVPNPPSNLPIIIVENTLEALQQLAKSYRDELNIKVVAVTGSNGKTTTKDILAELLAVKYKVQKTIGNFNNHIGLPLTILSLNTDTEVAVLEMGMSNFGEIDLLTKIAFPDACVITNIGDAHLAELGSREGIAKAKLEILNGLKPKGLFVYPGDEVLIKNYLEKTAKHFRVKTFGKSNSNDLYPTELKMTNQESVFKTNMSEETFHLPVLGEYNVLNSLAAMLIAREFDIPFEKMNGAFQGLRLTHMRMEMSPGINESQVLNDAYNASPTSMKAVLELVMNLEGYEKKVVVLGDMLELGPNEKEFHAEIGEFLDPTKIDYVYTFGNLSQNIADRAKKSFGDTRVFAFLDKQDLINHLKEQITPKTLVLVKASRGMKLEEVVNAIKA